MYKSINLIRILAFLLFLTPTIGILGSLFFHNFLIDTKSTFLAKIIDWEKESFFIGEKKYFECNKDNDYCNPDEQNYLEQENCNKYKYSKTPVDPITQKKINPIEYKNLDKNFLLFLKKTNNLNTLCFINSKYSSIYKIFPNIFHFIEKKLVKDPNFSLGTSKKINPFIYGETSISNVVKRFPINLIFKTLIYISIMIMIMYWYNFNRVLNFFINNHKINKFFIFGIISSLFLLLHVYNLGNEFESRLLNRLKSTYVVFFIFFEILAQIFLVKFLFDNKKIIFNYLNKIIVMVKLIFIFIISLITFFILILFIFYSLDDKFDYILEWNYFMILLFFYFLSSLVWKRNLRFNPTTT